MLIVTVLPDSVAPGGVAFAAAIVFPATVPPERIAVEIVAEPPGIPGPEIPSPKLALRASPETFVIQLLFSVVLPVNALESRPVGDEASSARPPLVLVETVTCAS